jgi:hypothetical protein
MHPLRYHFARVAATPPGAPKPEFPFSAGSLKWKVELHSDEYQNAFNWKSEPKGGGERSVARIGHEILANVSTEPRRYGDADPAKRTLPGYQFVSQMFFLEDIIKLQQASECLEIIMRERRWSTILENIVL